jgi:hypothetical protein
MHETYSTPEQVAKLEARREEVGEDECAGEHREVPRWGSITSTRSRAHLGGAKQETLVHTAVRPTVPRMGGLLPAARRSEDRGWHMENFEPGMISGKGTAEIYDDVPRGDEPETIAFLEELASGGPSLELAIGTGLIALPLAARGIRVDRRFP